MSPPRHADLVSADVLVPLCVIALLCVLLAALVVLYRRDHHDGRERAEASNGGSDQFGEFLASLEETTHALHHIERRAQAERERLARLRLEVETRSRASTDEAGGADQQAGPGKPDRPGRRPPRPSAPVNGGTSPP